MGTVVLISGQSLAIGTEIGVVADSALVAVTLDPKATLRLAGTQRAIATDAIVNGRARVMEHRNGFVDGCETVGGVDEMSRLNAFGAVVPVRAVEALVANSSEGLTRVNER